MRALASLLVLAACILVAETSARVAGVRRLPPDGPSLDVRLLETDPHLGFRCAAGLIERYEEVVGRPVVTTDGRGRRVTPQGAPGGASAGAAVLVCGDSFMFAAEVSDRETPSAQLAARLDGAARVVNLGVRGYSTVQALRALETALDAEPDARVAIYAFTPNDLFENLHPFHRLPRQVPTAWWEDGSLRFHQPTEGDVPWGDRFLAHWETIRPVEDLRSEAFAALEGDDARTLALEELGRQVVAADERRRARGLVGARTGLVERLRQASAALNGLAIVRERWRASRSAESVFGEDAQGPASPWASTGEIAPLLRWAEAHHGEDILVALMERMRDACEDRMVTLLVCSVRNSPHDPAAARFEHVAATAGFQVVSLADAYPHPREQYETQLVSGARDGHWNPAGAAAFAGALEGPTRRALAARTRR